MPNITIEEYRDAMEWAGMLTSVPEDESRKRGTMRLMRIARVLLALDGAWMEVAYKGRREKCPYMTDRERQAIAARHGLPVDPETCPECGGSGEVDVDKWLHPCPACQGKE